MTDLAVEKYHIFLPWKILSLVLQHALGHNPFALCSAVWSDQKQLAKAESVALYTSESIPLLASAFLLCKILVIWQLPKSLISLLIDWLIDWLITLCIMITCINISFDFILSIPVTTTKNNSIQIILLHYFKTSLRHRCFDVVDVCVSAVNNVDYLQHYWCDSYGNITMLVFTFIVVDWMFWIAIKLRDIYFDFTASAIISVVFLKETLCASDIVGK